MWVRSSVGQSTGERPCLYVFGGIYNSAVVKNKLQILTDNVNSGFYEDRIFVKCWQGRGGLRGPTWGSLDPTLSHLRLMYRPTVNKSQLASLTYGMCACNVYE